MKQILCVLLSYLMAFSSVSCTKTKKGSSSSEKPKTTEPADKKTIEDNEDDVDDQQNATDSDGLKLNNQYVINTINYMMQNGNLTIKDFDGKDITMDEYKLNPSQYFLLMTRNKDATQYQVLNTVSEKVEGTTSKYSLAYKIYKLEGKAKDFKGEGLGTPTVTDSLVLDSNPFKFKENIDAIRNLMKRLQENDELASNNASFGTKAMGFLFPTAYAGYDGKLTTMAVIFTSSAALLYIIGARNAAGVALAVGVTFWMLLVINNY